MKKTILVLLILFSSQLFSQTWKEQVRWSEYSSVLVHHKVKGAGTTKITEYVDLFSIVRANDGNIKVWKKTEFVNKTQSTITILKMLYEVDCKGRRIRTLQGSVTDDKGKNPQNSHDISAWEYIEPGSQDEDFLYYLTH